MLCFCRKHDLEVEHANHVRDGVPICNTRCLAEYTRSKANDTLIYNPTAPKALDVGSWNCH